ncbi:MAG: DUF421 domain-containing protein [Actinomycetes bacterium]
MYLLADQTASLIRFGVLDKVLRTVLVYAALILILRFVGRRTLAQLNPFDLVVLLLLSNVVQNAIIGPDNSVTGGVVGALTLVAANEVVVRVARTRPRFSRILAGRRAVLVREGRVDEHGLRNTGLSREELDEFAHVDRLDEVERMTLLPGGKIDVHLKADVEPATKHDVASLARQLQSLQASVDRLAR